LKKNIKKIENALDKICTLNGITYNLNSCKKDDDNYRLTGLIVESIKELKREIDEIKKRLT
jgi:hypothetical protein